MYLSIASQSDNPAFLGSGYKVLEIRDDGGCDEMGIIQGQDIRNLARRQSVLKGGWEWMPKCFEVPGLGEDKHRKVELGLDVDTRYTIHEHNTWYMVHDT